MNIRLQLARTVSAALGMALTTALTAAPSIYPTGTTIYDPDRAWNGYTVLIAPEEIGAVLIDMNGNTLKIWDDFNGATGGPARVLPGGYVVAAGSARARPQETKELVQQDWEGNTRWTVNRAEQNSDDDG
jgi:hypothetical protein